MSDDELERELGEHYAREREHTEAPSFETMWRSAQRTHQRETDRRRTVWVVSGFAVAAIGLLAFLPFATLSRRQSAAPLLLSESSAGYGVRVVEPLAFVRRDSLTASLKTLRGLGTARQEATP